MFHGDAEHVLVRAEPDALFTVEQPGWFRMLVPSTPTSGHFETRYQDQTLSYSTLSSFGQGYGVIVVYGELQSLNEWREAPETALRAALRSFGDGLTEISPEFHEATASSARLAVDVAMAPNTRLNHGPIELRGAERLVTTQRRIVAVLMLHGARRQASVEFDRVLQSVYISVP